MNFVTQLSFLEIDFFRQEWIFTNKIFKEFIELTNLIK